MRRLLATAVFVAPALAAADGLYHYQPGAHRDPFADTLAGNAPITVPDCTGGELCAVKLDEAKVTGIVTGTTSPMAMIEDGAGQYIVHVGTPIGQHGVVSKIQSGRVVVTDVIYSADVPRPIERVFKLERD